MDNKNRILYIEDNYQNRRLVRRLLKPKGYEIIEAEDGLQGIAIAAREKPDLILMDINMPGIDGMEATSRLKSSPDLAHIPVIAVTAAAMRGDRERIMAAGCDDYLQKPIDNDELIKLVQRFIGIPNKEAKQTRSESAIGMASIQEPKAHANGKSLDDKRSPSEQPKVLTEDSKSPDPKPAPSDQPKMPESKNTPLVAAPVSSQVQRALAQSSASPDVKVPQSQEIKEPAPTNNPQSVELPH